MADNPARIGIYGGSFNPPHIGHVGAVEKAMSALKLTQTLIVPVGHPPHKNLPAGTPPDKQRLELVNLAFGKLRGVRIYVGEIERGGVNYTADTVQRITKERPEAQFWFIMGTDMFLTLHQWVRPAQIFDCCRIAVLSRGNRDEADIRTQASFLKKNYGAQIDIVPGRPIEISSSQLRALLARGEAQAYLPSGVAEYIAGHGLYREGANRNDGA